MDDHSSKFFLIFGGVIIKHCLIIGFIIFGFVKLNELLGFYIGRQFYFVQVYKNPTHLTIFIVYFTIITHYLDNSRALFFYAVSLGNAPFSRCIPFPPPLQS